jgi:hypothetical protein
MIPPYFLMQGWATLMGVGSQKYEGIMKGRSWSRVCVPTSIHFIGHTLDSAEKILKFYNYFHGILLILPWGGETFLPFLI